ncbi:uncharacterized protein LOC106660791 [Cimex lectularius]|uniref:Uncharacterized protein n=1 Tax=Cimex lectularius TaxID=79782 RepID=A0A8I6R5I5_CIMLE|nr:uncharacterized protein LOC106660791 [Cimex lectularius]
MSTSVISRKGQNLVMGDILPRVLSILSVLEEDEQKMAVSTGEVQNIDPLSVRIQRKENIKALQRLLGDVDLPDLSEVEVDPLYTLSTLLEKFQREVVQLQQLYSHEKNNLKNISDSISMYTTRNDYLKTIAQGMTDSSTHKDQVEASNTGDLKQLFPMLKNDLDTVLNTCYPLIKTDIKNFLSKLESAERSDDEEDWWQEPSSDVDVSAICVLIEAKIIIQHPEKKTFFRLATLD